MRALSGLATLWNTEQSNPDWQDILGRGSGRYMHNYAYIGSLPLILYF